MSLLSPRNFAAPFTHKGSLLALVLVVLLFTILRLTISTSSTSAPYRILPELRDSRVNTGSITSGNVASGSATGALTSRPSEPRAVERTGASLEGRAAASFFDTSKANTAALGTNPRVAEPVNDAPSFSDNSDNDVLGEILGSAGGSKAPAQPQKQEPAPGQLDDIEQRLGLR